ncbi:FAD-dependent oxidoreductase [Pelagicoccus sp. SDUM812002]|uniref:FAD-dependent oxidoreductase n=1 Tax=Pelagicoccus sp. SDUM812002 TaxID=3041266 RepID=UPI0028106A71|nr:FAD-dependent oxidoreductase [Pelagicoccus sp. SDUM812002]MDQ8184655.1 FAD-dependent oxidoreductase [Pelagicoccus sp. SDUM812002]
MNYIPRSLFFSLVLILSTSLSFVPHALSQADHESDLVIYGATSAGIAAALQAERMGYSVTLIEPSDHIGGLTTGGLGQTDIGNKQVIGGIAREFYQRVKTHYASDEAWEWQGRSDYRDGGQTRTEAGEDAMWTFEPKVASAIFSEMLKEAGIQVKTGERLDRSGVGVKKIGSRIQSLETESGKLYKGKVFIDATYEGDLLAETGVSYAVGREANEQYGETLNGVQAGLWAPTLERGLSTNAANHQIAPGVSAYREPGHPESGVLPFIVAGGPGIEGSGDDGVQAYCYRACLTDHPENRIPFAKPESYDELHYELLFRHVEAGGSFYWINSAMPNRKTDTNNGGGFSGDFIGMNHAYPEASYDERKAIEQSHKDYQLGLYWSLANHPRVPQWIRDDVSRWGLPKDEYEETDHWSPQLYIREARRMIGQLVMTQHHCEGLEVVEDSVGMAAYGMDSHHVQRYVDANGYAQNEGNVQAHVAAPYPISYRSMLPKSGEADNLVVPVCVSSTHVAFGSIRMEPVFMVLGQSAATAACLSIEADSTLSELDVSALQARLLADGQILEN